MTLLEKGWVKFVVCLLSGMIISSILRGVVAASPGTSVLLLIPVGMSIYLMYTGRVRDWKIDPTRKNGEYWSKIAWIVFASLFWPMVLTRHVINTYVLKLDPLVNRTY